MHAMCLEILYFSRHFLHKDQCTIIFDDIWRGISKLILKKTSRSHTTSTHIPGRVQQENDSDSACGSGVGSGNERDSCSPKSCRLLEKTFKDISRTKIKVLKIT